MQLKLLRPGLPIGGTDGRSSCARGYTMGHYSAVQRTQIRSNEVGEREPILQSEVNQEEKQLLIILTRVRSQRQYW